MRRMGMAAAIVLMACSSAWAQNAKTARGQQVFTDQKCSFVFTKAGVYDYFCAVHPKMTGRITVK